LFPGRALFALDGIQVCETFLMLGGWVAIGLSGKFGLFGQLAHIHDVMAEAG
jgi:hypothetical protein